MQYREYVVRVLMERWTYDGERISETLANYLVTSNRRFFHRCERDGLRTPERAVQMLAEETPRMESRPCP